MESACDKACFILQQTHDGEDLAPEHLSLLQSAVNGWLTETGEVAFDALLASVKAGYSRPWFHGIEHLTIDHVGYVYWKGQNVEHFDFRDWHDKPYAYGPEGKAAAEEVADRCRQLETAGVPVNTTTAIWKWPQSLKLAEAAAC